MKGSFLLLGFTKVRYPDVWDAEEGEGRAKKKALALPAKTIMLWFSLHWDCPQDVCPWDVMIERWLDGTLSRQPLWPHAHKEATAEMEKRYGVVRWDSV